MGNSTEITRAKLALAAFLIACGPFAYAADSGDVDQIRVQHAKELLGNRYHQSVVKRAESASDENGRREFIEFTLRESLPAPYATQAKRLAQAVFEESRKYEFDPFFLMAVMENESGFNPEVVGSVGEIGLMQLRPSTAQELARAAGIRWQGKRSLLDPVTNIRLGAFFLSQLRGRYDSQGGLYLAAYNMGARSLARSLEKRVQPKAYAIHVMRCYLRLYKRLYSSQAAKANRLIASVTQ